SRKSASAKWVMSLAKVALFCSLAIIWRQSKICANEVSCCHKVKLCSMEHKLKPSLIIFSVLLKILHNHHYCSAQIVKELVWFDLPKLSIEIAWEIRLRTFLPAVMLIFAYHSQPINQSMTSGSMWVSQFVIR